MPYSFSFTLPSFLLLHQQVFRNTEQFRRGHIHMSMDLQCLKDLIKLRCIWNRYIDWMCCIYDILDILMVDSDRSARFEVTFNDHRDLGIQYCTSCESAADRMVYFLRISARFCCQNKCFGYYCDRVINNNLVGKLCNTSASASADQQCRRSENIKILFIASKSFWSPPAMIASVSCDSSWLATGYRCIYKSYTFCF